MSLSAGHGTPIRIKVPLQKTAEPPAESVEESFAESFAPKTLPIMREEQEHDAWCYAATTAMVINFCHPGDMVRQCKIAAFVKTPPGGQLECCQTLGSLCAVRGCVLDDFVKIFGEFKVKFEDSGKPGDPVIERVPPPKLKSELNTNKRPVMVIVEWNDQPGSHALVVTGIEEDGSRVFVIDSLEGAPYGGWQRFNALVNGFGFGKWVRTFPGLERV
jgi:hypothetical protein